MEMHAGLLFKQNCDWSWITAATLVSYRINRDAQNLIESRYVKTRVARSCVFGFLKMISFRLIGCYLLFERRNEGGSLSMSLPVPSSRIPVCRSQFFLLLNLCKNVVNCFKRCSKRQTCRDEKALGV